LKKTSVFLGKVVIAHYHYAYPCGILFEVEYMPVGGKFRIHRWPNSISLKVRCLQKNGMCSQSVDSKSSLAHRRRKNSLKNNFSPGGQEAKATDQLALAAIYKARV
jgi:hypothetical protein